VTNLLQPVRDDHGGLQDYRCGEHSTTSESTQRRSSSGSEMHACVSEQRPARHGNLETTIRKTEVYTGRNHTAS
jgi:hypothetical protein